MPNAVWRAADGTVTFVFANARYSVTSTSFRYVIDPAIYGIRADGSWALYRMTLDDDKIRPKFERLKLLTGPAECIEALPGADVLVLAAMPVGREQRRPQE